MDKLLVLNWKMNPCFLREAEELAEKENQKGIIIGESGERLKKVGMQARLEMEKMLGNKVFLKLWCKVKSSWSTDKRALQSLGYFD